MNDERSVNVHNVQRERSAWKMRTSGIVIKILELHLQKILKVI